MQHNEKKIRSVLLPLKKDVLLLPHSALVEIIPEREISPIGNGPDWLLGEIEWSNEVLPLLSFEVALGYEEPEVAKRSRVIVLGYLSEHKKYQYLAIRATGVPRLVQLQAGSLVEKEATGFIQTFVNFYGELNQQRVIVPNMVALEAHIANL